MKRREFITKALAGGVALSNQLPLSELARLAGLSAKELGSTAVSSLPLHNGIVPPDPFPPQLTEFIHTGITPYYIENPPDPIIINVGRQLFVDDFLVESAEGLERTFHAASTHPEPLISPLEDEVSEFQRPDGTNVVTWFAAPYSDGVWWDVYRGRFRAFLLSGRDAVRLAESDDGLSWHRVPGLKGSPDIMSVPAIRDSGAVWIDFETDDEDARYKMAHFNFIDKKNWLYASSDGVKWPSYDNPVGRTAHYSSDPDVPTGDRTTFFRDPFRQKWVWSLRDIIDLRPAGRQFNRVRRFAETSDLLGDPEVTASNTPWLIAHPDDGGGFLPQLYNLDGIAYESLMLFMLSIWTADDSIDVDAGTAISKANAVHLGFSRDGFYCTRPPDRVTPFIGPGDPETWNEGNVQSVAGGIVIVGPPEQEELLIYFSARENQLPAPDRLERRGRMGVARLRRDGFASFDAGADTGLLETRRIRFDHSDGFLFVNADAETESGEVRVELASDDGTTIPGFSFDDCTPMTVDSTRQIVTWASGQSLAALSGTPFRVRFRLRSSRLFSFWISPDVSGASNGFLAAGGPGYEGYRDESPESSEGLGPVDSVPREFSLESIFPNPFSSATTIRFRIASPRRIDLSLYDELGRLVRILERGLYPPGLHEVVLDGRGLAPGVYVCRLASGGAVTALKTVRSP